VKEIESYLNDHTQADFYYTQFLSSNSSVDDYLKATKYALTGMEGLDFAVSAGTGNITSTLTKKCSTFGMSFYVEKPLFYVKQVSLLWDKLATAKQMKDCFFQPNPIQLNFIGGTLLLGNPVEYPLSSTAAYGVNLANLKIQQFKASLVNTNLSNHEVTYNLFGPKKGKKWNWTYTVKKAGFLKPAVEQKIDFPDSGVYAFVFSTKTGFLSPTKSIFKHAGICITAGNRVIAFTTAEKPFLSMQNAYDYNRMWYCLFIPENAFSGLKPNVAGNVELEITFQFYEADDPTNTQKHSAVETESCFLKVDGRILAIDTTGQGSGRIKINNATYDLPYSGVITPDAQVTIEAVPDSDSTFVQWAGYITSQQEKINFNTNPAGNTNLSVEFAAKSNVGWSTGLYVIDRNDNEIRRYDLNGSNSQVAIPSGVLSAAYGIVVDSKGRLLVYDSGAGQIKVFESGNIAPINTFGPNYTNNICMMVDNGGLIYVSAQATGSVYVYDSDYNHINTLDFSGVLGGHYEGPKYMALDPVSGNIVFSTEWASSGPYRGMVEITKTGTVVRYFGPSGNSLNDCEFTTDGHLLVEDGTGGGYGIRVYDASRNQTQVILQSYSGHPFIELDNSGKLYISDRSGSRIVVYDLDYNQNPSYQFTITDPQLKEPSDFVIKE
jgi:hypothetical protein